ncbi:MAG: type II toxin-antitoxin system PemK/MazF family toxin [Chlorobiaceae bacterium]|nr:type II toxin-antitoxin system PemK/MazF family toxin [Chlorobiaceae bacterium]
MRRFDVWLVQLDPTQGSEIKKTRPCVIISPDEMSPLQTVIVAPMTSQGFPFPTRIACAFQGKDGFVVLDQIRTVDKTRLVKKLGVISNTAQTNIIHCLQEMFA